MLRYRLFTTGETLGALNLYSRSLDAFDPDDINNGYYLAAHLAIALAGAETTEQLTSAIASRTAIGQAEGILMERFDLQPAQAFAVLTRISQHSNVRLRLVALELVKTRKLPETSKEQPASDVGSLPNLRAQRVWFHRRPQFRTGPRGARTTRGAESPFKTVNYCPGFPGLFNTLHAARTACSELFDAVPSDSSAARNPPQAKMLTPPGPTSSPTTMRTAPHNSCFRRIATIPEITRMTARIHKSVITERPSFLLRRALCLSNIPHRDPSIFRSRSCAGGLLHSEAVAESGEIEVVADRRWRPILGPPAR